jgi:hypothetical protein
MSTKGMSTVAARMLVDQLCGPSRIPLLIVHDFDKAGFSILGTLRTDNRRYEFKHKIEAINLGLSLGDVRECGLASESVAIADKSQFRANLRGNGATPEEIDFLLTRKERVELNAFTSGDLVSWLERKFEKNHVRKVVPDVGVLSEAYRDAFKRQFIRAAIPRLTDEASKLLDRRGIPVDLHEQVEDFIARHPAEPWDLAIARLARKAVRGEGLPTL